MNTNKPSPSDAPPPPWWQVGMVWLVLGGPAAVVVAGIVTAVIDGLDEFPAQHRRLGH